MKLITALVSSDLPIDWLNCVIYQQATSDKRVCPSIKKKLLKKNYFRKLLKMMLRCLIGWGSDELWWQRITTMRAIDVTTFDDGDEIETTYRRNSAPFHNSYRMLRYTCTKHVQNMYSKFGLERSMNKWTQEQTTSADIRRTTKHNQNTDLFICLLCEKPASTSELCTM